MPKLNLVVFEMAFFPLMNSITYYHTEFLWLQGDNINVECSYDSTGKSREIYVSMVG